MPEGLNAVRMTTKYRPFLDQIAPGARIINFANKATGRDCDICGHTPEKRPPKPGYPDVSEEMRLMRVRVPSGTDMNKVTVGKTNFTVTGNLVEWNVCKDSAACHERAAKMTNDDGSYLYDSPLLEPYRR